MIVSNKETMKDAAGGRQRGTPATGGGEEKLTLKTVARAKREGELQESGSRETPQCMPARKDEKAGARVALPSRGTRQPVIIDGSSGPYQRCSAPVRNHPGEEVKECHKSWVKKSLRFITREKKKKRAKPPMTEGVDIDEA